MHFARLMHYATPRAPPAPLTRARPPAPGGPPTLPPPPARAQGRGVDNFSRRILPPHVFDERSGEDIDRRIDIEERDSRKDLIHLAAHFSLRDGFRYRIVDSRSLWPSHCCTVRRSTPAGSE